jgi:hypothetical protein
MAAVPLKSGYGPTLSELLAPRWRRVPLLLRGLVLLICVGLVVVVVGAALTLQDARISYSGPVAFHFNYKHLYRTAPEPGGYVKVSRRKHGLLEDSFAVEPLLLPSYEGSLTGELPLFATRYIRELATRYQGFVFEGEGKSRVNTVPGYNIFYLARIEGQRVFGRDVLLLPETPGALRGVVIVMHTTPHANSEVKTVQEVATAGVLQAALHTFTFD